MKTDTPTLKKRLLKKYKRKKTETILDCGYIVNDTHISNGIFAVAIEVLHQDDKRLFKKIVNNFDLQNQPPINRLFGYYSDFQGIEEIPLRDKEGNYLGITEKTREIVGYDSDILDFFGLRISDLKTANNKVKELVLLKGVILL